MVFWCGEGCVLDACSTTSSSSTSSSSSRPAAAISFFPESRRDVKPRGKHVFGGRPSFSSIGVSVWRRVRLEACSTTSSSTTRSMQQEEQQEQQQAQQAQQAQQLNSLCFYQNPEGTSKPRGTCFWRLFRPSVAWCFGVAKGAFWKLAAPPPAAPLAACSGSSSSRPSRPSKPSSWTRYVFTRIRRDVKPRGQHVFGGRSVLQ